MMVYKILRDAEWHALRAAGQTVGAPVDVADGFVHLSTAAQLRATAARHFAGEDHLWLLALEADALGPALRWERSRADALFPHLYAPLRLADVRWAQPLRWEGTAHGLPATIP